MLFFHYTHACLFIKVSHLLPYKSLHWFRTIPQQRGLWQKIELESCISSYSKTASRIALLHPRPWSDLARNWMGSFSPSNGPCFGPKNMPWFNLTWKHAWRCRSLAHIIMPTCLWNEIWCSVPRMHPKYRSKMGLSLMNCPPGSFLINKHGAQKIRYTVNLLSFQSFT